MRTEAAPISMRATWPGTDVVIELVQDEDGYVSATFPQTSKPNDILCPDHDADIIRKLGFYIPDPSVPSKECSEMGRVE